MGANPLDRYFGLAMDHMIGPDFAAGLGSDAVTANDIRVDKSYAGKALKTVHTGPYTRMIETHDKLLAYLSAHGFVRNGAAFYRFVDDAGSTPEPQLHTEIYAPID